MTPVQRTFFDEGPEAAPSKGEPSGDRSALALSIDASASDDAVQAGASAEEWNEVPQAVFLSWSVPRQLSYCAARDDDAADRATSDEERQFYQDRADWYHITVQREVHGAT